MIGAAERSRVGWAFGFIMQDEVIVRYQFSDEQMKQIASNLPVQRRILHFAPPLGGIVIIIITLRFFWTAPDAYDIAASFLPVLLLGVFLIFLYPLAKWITLRQLRRNLVYNVWVTWTITAERLFCDGGEAFHHDFAWTMVSRIVETSAGFLLFSGYVAYWLPVTGFADASNIQIFKDLARQKVAKFETRT